MALAAQLPHFALYPEDGVPAFTKRLGPGIGLAEDMSDACYRLCPVPVGRAIGHAASAVAASAHIRAQSIIMLQCATTQTCRTQTFDPLGRPVVDLRSACRWHPEET